MSKNSSILKETFEEEIAIIDAILKPYVAGEQRVAHEPVLTDDLLDRQLADKNESGNIALVLNSPGLSTKTAIYAIMQDSHRIRRDVKASRAGHKRLMIANLETLHRRGKELAFQLTNKGSR